MKKIIVILAIFTIITSCVTKISDLKSNPIEYNNKIVLVEGKITKLIKIPFTDYKVFELQDSSDNIVVFSIEDRKKSDEVKIKAKVIVYDSANHKKSTKDIVNSIKDYLKEKGYQSKKIDNTATSITNTITALLSKMEATYFLIEESNDK